MPRGIRLLEKKRGERRTGAPWAGRLGEAVFYAFFLVVGLVGAAYVFLDSILPELYLIETTCRVVKKRLGQRMELGKLRYRPEIQLQYEVGGKMRSEPAWAYDAAYQYRFDEADARAILAKFSKGQHYRCWYDERNPAYVVLVRHRWMPWGVFVVAALFAVFGGVGLAYSLVHSRTSVERRLSRTAPRTPDRPNQRRRHQPNADPPGYPAAPPVDNIINSPGTLLNYRLPIDASPGWRLVGFGSAAVLWNAVVALLVYHLFSRFRAGYPSLLWTISLLPFAAGGVWLAVAWIRQLLLTTGVGVTRVEVENHPFRPGGTFEIGLYQTGRMKVNCLEVLLVCDERATYYQGTDMRRATQRVFEQVVFRKEDFDIQPGAAYEEQFKLTVPPHAMHSLAVDHNEVLWALIVRGDLVRWPNYERRFPICVYPPAPEQGKGQVQ